MKIVEAISRKFEDLNGTLSGLGLCEGVRQERLGWPVVVYGWRSADYSRGGVDCGFVGGFRRVSLMIGKDGKIEGGDGFVYGGEMERVTGPPGSVVLYLVEDGKLGVHRGVSIFYSKVWWLKSLLALVEDRGGDAVDLAQSYLGIRSLARASGLDEVAEEAEERLERLRKRWGSLFVE